MLKKFLKKKIQKVLFILLFIIAGVSIALAIFLRPYLPTESVVTQIEQSQNIALSQSEYIQVIPDKPYGKGIIIYPGGLVDHRAYVPLAQSFAKEGYLTFIIEMPLDLAIISPQKGEIVLNKYPEINDWTVLGHSLGGSMAARFVSENDELNQLVFLASYVEQGLDLSKTEIKVLSIAGSKDDIIDSEAYKTGNQRVPSTAEYAIIQGANHAGFGDYGEQRGDSTADISREEQVKQTVEIVLSWLEEME